MTERETRAASSATSASGNVDEDAGVVLLRIIVTVDSVGGGEFGFVQHADLGMRSGQPQLYSNGNSR